MVRQILVQQVAHRQVYRDLQRMSFRVAFAALANCLGDNMPRQHNNRARLLGYRDKVIGTEKTELGVLPAYQGLCATYVAVGQRHFWLVPGLDLAAPQRCGQVIDNLQAAQEFVLATLLVDTYPFIGRLGVAPRDGRKAQQVCGSSAMTWEGGYADLGLQDDVDATQRHARTKQVLDSINVCERIFDVLTGQHEYEFIRSGMTQQFDIRKVSPQVFCC